MKGARGARRRMDDGGWAGLRRCGAGSWEGGLRAPVTALQAALLTKSLARPHFPHSRTVAHHTLSIPFSSRVRRGWC